MKTRLTAFEEAEADRDVECDRPRHGSRDDESESAAINSSTWLDAVDWALWANTFFMLGSIMYLISAIINLWYWECEECLRAAKHVDFWAAVNFIIDSILYIIDWWRCKKNNLLGLHGGPVSKGRLAQRIETLDYYSIGNWLFFIGSCGYLTQAWYYLYGPQEEEDGSSPPYALIIDFSSSHLFLFCSAAALFGWYYARRAERVHNAPHQFRLFTTSFRHFDWSGWGDILFMVGSVLYASGSYVCGLNSSDTAWEVCAWWMMMGAVLFIFDSLSYFIAFGVARRMARETSRPLTGSDSDEDLRTPTENGTVAAKRGTVKYTPDGEWNGVPVVRQDASPTDDDGQVTATLLSHQRPRSHHQRHS